MVKVIDIDIFSIRYLFNRLGLFIIGGQGVEVVMGQYWEFRFDFVIYQLWSFGLC